MGEFGSRVAYVPGKERGKEGRVGSVSVGCEHTDIDPSLLLLPHLYNKATHNVVLAL